MADLTTDPETPYQAGYTAGLTWLSSDGAWYLDPTIEVGRDEYPPPAADDDENQGFNDAVKEAAWHTSHPGEPCHIGVGCPAREWAARRNAAFPSPHRVIVRVADVGYWEACCTGCEWRAGQRDDKTAEELAAEHRNERCGDCGHLVPGDGSDEGHGHCGPLPHTGPLPPCERCGGPGSTSPEPGPPLAEAPSLTEIVEFLDPGGTLRAASSTKDAGGVQ